MSITLAHDDVATQLPFPAGDYFFLKSSREGSEPEEDELVEEEFVSPT